MMRRRVPLMTWPVGDYLGRRRSVAVVERDGEVELQFTGQRGGITRAAVRPSDAFRLWGAICGNGETVQDIRWRASVSGHAVTRDDSGRLVVTELRVTRRYARRGRDIMLDGHARACLRAQIARAVLVATAPRGTAPREPVRMPAPRGTAPRHPMPAPREAVT